MRNLGILLLIGSSAFAYMPPPDWMLAANPTMDPPVLAASALVMDAESGRVLWEKEGTIARFPASTTKIMTSLVLLDYSRPGDKIKAPSDVNKVGESSMNLKPGEVVSAKDMLVAMMLRSANDACYAVAQHVSDSVATFADRMNEKALKLGCMNTHFTNPNGLHDANHYTCAYDLALMAREGMTIPEFRAVVSTKQATIQRSSDSKDTLIKNRNKLLWENFDIDGVKTGFTKPAGHCFVGTAKRDGWRIITVVLKSPDWKAETKLLTDWAFRNFEMRTISGEGEQGLLNYAFQEPVQVAMRPEEQASVQGSPKVPEVATKGDPLGEGTVILDGKPVGKGQWVALNTLTVEAPLPAPSKAPASILVGAGAATLTLAGLALRSLLRF